jgi:nucleoside-diphosphate-sugar epimerase
MSRLLITGATGFVGNKLAEIVEDARFVIRNHQNCDFSDTFNIANFDQHTKWDGAFKGVHSIIHLAGLAHSKSLSDNDFDTVNTMGTLHFAKQAVLAGVKRFVFVSSIGVNGPFTFRIPFHSIDVPYPQNPYARSKYNAELALKQLSETTGLEVVIVRPPLIYGPNAPGNFGALNSLASKLSFLPFGLINNRRSFISVQNLADLLVTCAKHPDANGHIFLASENETVSIKEFTNAIAKGHGTKLIQLPVPVWLMRLAGKLLFKSAMVEQLVSNLEVDSSNLKEVLDWVPPYTMEESMAFLKQEK